MEHRCSPLLKYDVSRSMSRTRYRSLRAQSHRCCVAYDVRGCEDARVSVDERVAVLDEGLLATINEYRISDAADCGLRSAKDHFG